MVIGGLSTASSAIEAPECSFHRSTVDPGLNLRSAYEIVHILPGGMEGFLDNLLCG
jgi:hypothetical protein